MNETIKDHPHFGRIRDYYDGCNRIDVELLKHVLADDVEHYTTDMERVSGADNLIAFFKKFAPAVKAHWMIDHCVIQGDQAVIEWTMRWEPTDKGPELKRGSEWYVFERDKIAEIRAYYTNPYAKPDMRSASLKGFDYSTRGYSSIESQL